MDIAFRRGSNIIWIVKVGETKDIGFNVLMAAFAVFVARGRPVAP